MSEGEKNDILVALKKGMSVQQCAMEFGRDASTISRLIQKLRPTTELARSTLHARASELVERVLEKADVDQLIDLLSRPNIGVLEPATKSGNGSSGGPNVLINIQAGSLAAVNEAEFASSVPKAIEAPSEIGGRNIQVGSVNVAQAYKGD